MENNSPSSSGKNGTLRGTFDKVIVVQVLVALFLCINTLLIVTFFTKDVFYTTMRYILFAQTLLSDCVMLVVTNVLLLFIVFGKSMHMGLCLIFFILAAVCNFITPVTLTMMTLERYVAICMPLRHADLCSSRSLLWVLIIIHGLSLMPCTVTLLIFFVSITSHVNTQSMGCHMERFIVHKWQGHLRSAMSQFYFFIMLIVIIFSYIHITKVAKAASGEDKHLSSKGLQTVLLHGFQLLLCLIQLFSPLVETAALQVNFMFFNNLRYFNYIMFIITPRCLSPLIYGLRDEKFFLALKYCASCGYLKNKF